MAQAVNAYYTYSSNVASSPDVSSYRDHALLNAHSVSAPPPPSFTRQTSPNPSATVYAALYSTLHARWGRQAEDLAAHSELAGILRYKRPYQSEESQSEHAQLDDQDDAGPGAEVEDRAERFESMELKTAHKRRRMVDSKPSLSWLEPSPTEACRTESDETLNVPPPPADRSRRSSSLPPSSGNPSEDAIRADLESSRLARSTSAIGSQSYERVEGLLKVVRSFEAVLNCRIDMWKTSSAREL